MILKQGYTFEQLTSAVLILFPLFVYPVKFTKAMFETSILEVPTYEPLSPESWVIAAAIEAPLMLKFSKRMFCTTPLC